MGNLHLKFELSIHLSSYASQYTVDGQTCMQNNNIIIIIHSFLYRHKVVTSEAVAEQVRSCQSLSIVVSQVK